MKLKEYVEHLNKFVERGYGDREVVYSKDDEGNSIRLVNFKPTLCKQDEEDCNMYYFDHFEEEESTHVCVN